MSPPLRVVALLFPGCTQLDLTGPAQVFARFPGAQVDLAWRDTEPVATDCGWSIVPTTTLADAPPADVLFVPGGDGTFELLGDEDVLAFLRRQAAGARWVTSVCTGSFLLAAAGLLDGYRATTHWASLPLLAELGALPVAERVVVDRDRMTGAGITSGIDFALVLAAEELGEDVARRLQLMLEYDPQPPFDAGSPATADPAEVAAIRAAMRDARLGRVQRAAARRVT
ncbi:DJ-1/PfpI family protein [Oerskovia jenensis]|uniref:Cyclohexyl-isocyanide hydratase n=1 Tax=Oerskovia jenensis TaxID=162169 RepID=A0ABS2LBG0_9CELL|nr:DJ-1/PfpI family protein [Oerskovia jenensis]MBM7477758.1 cyclohexyl-isocyanide hydratase [Oerskovia jenensis]